MRNPIRLLAAAALMLAIAGVMFVTGGRSYEVTAEVSIEPDASHAYQSIIHRDLGNEARFAASDEVAAVAEKTLGTGDHAVNVTPNEDQMSLLFSAQGSSGASAAEIANAYAGAYIEVRTVEIQESILSAIDELRDRIARLDAELEGLGEGVERTTKQEQRQAVLFAIESIQPAIEVAGDRFTLKPATESGATANATGSRLVTGCLFAALALAGTSLGTMHTRTMKPRPQP